MFDTHNYRTGDSYTRVDVTEKRAATDESVRLLREMEEKALNNILACVKVDDNEFKATWWTYTDNFSYNDKVGCRFNLNGKQYEFKIDLPCKYSGNVSEIGLLVKNAVQEEISKILTLDLFVNSGRIIRDVYAQKI